MNVLCYWMSVNRCVSILMDPTPVHVMKAMKFPIVTFTLAKVWYQYYIMHGICSYTGTMH